MEQVYIQASFVEDNRKQTNCLFALIPAFDYFHMIVIIWE